MFAACRKYFFSGLLIWIPIWVTILVIRFILNLFNNVYYALPAHLQVDAVTGIQIPGIGILFTIALLLITGMIGANFLGKKIVRLWDKLIGKIPGVSSVYNGIKQVMDTMFSSKGKAFRKVLLVQYPRPGLWSIAFQTGVGSAEVNRAIGEDEVVTIFIPTTPNPTSGFLMMVPKRDVQELDMTVDQGLKFIISLGVVQPGSAVARAPKGIVG
jgi:uncharacterized membrane protein